MKGDCLEADHVISRRNALGDSGRPRVVVGNHLAIAPGSASDGAGDKTSLVNLKPAQGVHVGAGAVSAAIGHVRDLRLQVSDTLQLDILEYNVPLDRTDGAMGRSSRR